MSGLKFQSLSVYQYLGPPKFFDLKDRVQQISIIIVSVPSSFVSPFIQNLCPSWFLNRLKTNDSRRFVKRLIRTEGVFLLIEVIFRDRVPYFGPISYIVSGRSNHIGYPNIIVRFHLQSDFHSYRRSTLNCLCSISGLSSQCRTGTKDWVCQSS